MAVSSDVVIETELTKAYGCTAIVNKDGKVIAAKDKLEEGLLTTII